MSESGKSGLRAEIMRLAAARERDRLTLARSPLASPEARAEIRASIRWKDEEIERLQAEAHNALAEVRR